uniref:LGC1 n=1 Tax=Leersia perrieri TaxID=77586 RepID=A0A0D9WS65_9ORYZ
MAYQPNTATVLLFLAAAAAVIMSCDAAAGDCKLSDITVTTARTGKVVAGQPEYEVTMANGCDCPQNGVWVRCAGGGVQSVEPVDESKIRAESGDGRCIVNDGMPVARGSPVTFTYAWSQQQDFPVDEATPRC